MPPPYSKGGYSQLPQRDDSPYSAAPVPGPAQQPTWGHPVQGYAPAPPVFQQQSSNTVCGVLLQIIIIKISVYISL